MATQSSSPKQGGFAGWRESAPSSENGADGATLSTERSETSEPDPASDRSTRQQILEADFAELKDGTLLEVVQDLENSARTLLAVWKDGGVRYVEELEDDAHVLVPRQRKRNQIFDQLRLPNQARPYDSVQILLTRLERLISRCVSVEATHLPVLADFALSTWLVDRLSIAPPSFCRWLTAVRKDHVVEDFELGVPSSAPGLRHHLSILLQGLRAIYADHAHRRSRICQR